MKSWAQIYLPPIDSSFDFPTLSLRDSASQEMRVLEEKEIYRMYVCGITPYDATHLGHAATYVTFDLINRYLTAAGKKVLFVENVTDIDDPLLERATRDGVDWMDLAQSQVELFRGDMSDLHVIPPQNYIGAVEAIPLIIEAITKLQSYGSIYRVEDDFYFSVRSDSTFGSRSHLSQTEMLRIFAERGGDPGRVGKRDPLDALVWLGQREGEPGWPSPFGPGRPGWHIECCAIALHYLQIDEMRNNVIDIQGGGSDLIFPHHEMGAAQATLLAGREYAGLYVHSGMIGLDGEKMSKSLGNLVFLSRLISEGTDPMAIRLALIADHYSQYRMWSSAKLEGSIAFLNRLRLCLSKPEVAPSREVVQAMILSLSQDLDTVIALKHLETWCDDTDLGKTGGSPGELARAIDLLLGISI